MCQSVYNEPFITTTTVAHYALRNTDGGCNLAFDYQPYVVGSSNAPAGRMLVMDASYGVNYQFQSRIAGADLNALQTNFSINSNRSVATAFNTLDNASGTLTALQMIDSGLTASTMVSCNATKQLQSTTRANLNGCNASFSGSSLTMSMTEDLQTTASPAFESRFTIQTSPSRWRVQLHPP